MLRFRVVGLFACVCMLACSFDCVCVCRCLLQLCVSYYSGVCIAREFCVRVFCLFMCVCMLVLRVIVCAFALVCCKIAFHIRRVCRLRVCFAFIVLFVCLFVFV